MERVQAALSEQLKARNNEIEIRLRENVTFRVLLW